MTPSNSFTNSSVVCPVSSDMKPRSTRAFSDMDTASASLAVSTWVISINGLMVRFVNISALRSSSPFSSSTSSEHKRQ